VEADDELSICGTLVSKRDSAEMMLSNTIMKVQSVVGYLEGRDKNFDERSALSLANKSLDELSRMARVAPALSDSRDLIAQMISRIGNDNLLAAQYGRDAVSKMSLHPMRS
jgi:hypothetical protein